MPNDEQNTQDQENGEKPDTQAQEQSKNDQPSGGDNSPKGKDGDKQDPYAALRGRDLTADEAATLLEKLQAANGEAASHRHRLREFEQANESETEKKIREAREDAEKTTAEKFAGIIKRSAASAAFATAGAAKGHDSLYRLLDQEKITVDDDGTVKGLDAEIARIKDEFPALFATDTDDSKSARRRQASQTRVDGGDKKIEQKKTSAQRHAERVLGRS